VAKPEPAHYAWTRSSASGNGPNCVEVWVVRADDGIQVPAAAT
jgi:hypothetical protein